MKIENFVVPVNAIYIYFPKNIQIEIKKKIKRIENIYFHHF